ncbi:unnamed protein product [Lepeophtheirus salmonis]|uniref:(salmon louse) hypothetical protein n=3 Tax=Lepeophtheirus salmonis TaxID=72036 RepID=A0A7R8CT56_LEPSM|nr:unnamed protein product [Lepeophtheirus salmonis]CAF2885750.1 unnamed protein product [Lepeophtheirus salmonis]
MTAFQSLARSPRIKYMKDCYGRNEWATWNPPNIKFGIYAFLLIFVQIIYFVRLSVKGRSVRRQMNTNRGPMVVKNDSFISIHIMKDVGYSITFAILCICCPMSGILLSPTNCVGLSTVTHWIYALAVTIFIIPMDPKKPHRKLSLNMLSILVLTLLLSTSYGLPIDSLPEGTNNIVNEDATVLLNDSPVEESSTPIQTFDSSSSDDSSNYNFGFSIIDGINDASIERTETRENNKVTGAYSYTDGYIKQTVVYVADEFGFRVIDMNTEEIGDGPIRNESGTAIVQSYIDGVETNYAVRAEPQGKNDGLSYSDGGVISDE